MNNFNTVPLYSEVAVIGSGISGLSFTYYLANLRPDLKITIFEKNSRSGGYIHTTKTNNITLEKGPRTIRSKSDGALLLLDLLLSTNHQDEVYGVTTNSLGNKKYLLSWENDKLIEAPSNFASAFQFLFGKNVLTNGLVWSIIKEPWIPGIIIRNDESIEDFFTRRFGNTLPNNILSGIYAGIFAGDVKNLSLRSIMPSVDELKKKNRSIILSHIKIGIKSIGKFVLNKILNIFGLIKPNWNESSLLKHYQVFFAKNNLVFLKKLLKKIPIIVCQDGLETIIKIYLEELNHSENVNILYDVEIASLVNDKDSITINYKQDGVINSKKFTFVNSTISAKELSKIILFDDLNKPLNSINYSKVRLINIFIKNRNYIFDKPGFGYLIPKNYYSKNPNYLKEAILGIIFDSDNEHFKTKIFNDKISSFTNKINENLISYKENIKNDELMKNKEIDTQIQSFDTKLNQLATTSKAVTNQDDYTKLTLMMGGHYWSNGEIPDESTALQYAFTALKRQLNMDINAIPKDDLIIETKVTEDDGIPQYEIGYQELLEKIQFSVDKEFNGKIGLSGMCFNKGIGVPDCVSNGYRLATMVGGIN